MVSTIGPFSGFAAQSERTDVWQVKSAEQIKNARPGQPFPKNGQKMHDQGLFWLVAAQVIDLPLVKNFQWRTVFSCSNHSSPLPGSLSAAMNLPTLR